MLGLCLCLFGSIGSVLGPKVSFWVCFNCVGVCFRSVLNLFWVCVGVCVGVCSGVYSRSLLGSFWRAQCWVCFGSVNEPLHISVMTKKGLMPPRSLNYPWQGL